MLFHFQIGKRSRLDPVPSGRLFILRQQLDGADSVPADFSKQIEWRRAPGTETLLDTAPDFAAVRQQVVEEVLNHIASVG